MYAVIRTWPDIASYLARFMANPGHAHWEAVKHVIRDLKGTKDAKLILGKGSTLSWEGLDYRTAPECKAIATPTKTHRSITT